jgi:Rrf2 family protein
MKFSTKAEYGLRAIVCLDKTGEKPVSLALIAKQEGLSLAYLERLFAQLKKAKLVRADIGVKGGYYLNRPTTDITVLAVIEALEGSVAPFDCVGKGKCNHPDCKIHPVWNQLYTQIKKTLREMNLEQIM